MIYSLPTNFMVQFSYFYSFLRHFSSSWNPFVHNRAYNSLSSDWFLAVPCTSDELYPDSPMHYRGTESCQLHTLKFDRILPGPFTTTRLYCAKSVPCIWSAPCLFHHISLECNLSVPSTTIRLHPASFVLPKLYPCVYNFHSGSNIDV
jgi:hypothetical protein